MSSVLQRIHRGDLHEPIFSSYDCCGNRRSQSEDDPSRNFPFSSEIRAPNQQSDRADTPWSESFPPPQEMDTFRRVLQKDGFVVADRSLRPALPTDIGLPSIGSELMQLLERHGFSTAKGHLEQAFDADARGNWASANGQLRSFFDALLDKIAEKLDPSVHAIGSGQPRRAKLASLRFLSISLNEWDNGGTGFINGLVRRLHPQGAHPGLSDEDDSTFRLHFVLITAALLLRRYDRTSRR